MGIARGDNHRALGLKRDEGPAFADPSCLRYQVVEGYWQLKKQLMVFDVLFVVLAELVTVSVTV